MSIPELEAYLEQQEVQQRDDIDAVYLDKLTDMQSELGKDSPAWLEYVNSQIDHIRRLHTKPRSRLLHVLRFLGKQRTHLRKLLSSQ